MSEDKIQKIREYGLIVKQEMTQPTRRGKQPKPVWNISAVNLSKYEHVLRDSMGLKKWRGQFSAWEDPTDELLGLLEEEQALTVGEQQEYAASRSEARAERLDDRAHKHAQASTAAYERSNEISERFAFGQPILVGHHSEARARRDRDKMHAAMSKSVAESDYAGELAGRAEGSRRNAVMKLDCTLEYAGNRLKEAKAELNTCERQLTHQVNDYVRYVGDDAKLQGHTCIIIKMDKDRTWVNLAFHDEKDADGKTVYPSPRLGKVPIEQIESLLSEGRRLDFENRRANAAEAIEHWTAKVQELGGDRFSPETIKKGDYVRTWVGLTEVVRVNRQSVSVKTRYSWTETVPYTKIKAHMTAEEYAARSNNEAQQNT